MVSILISHLNFQYTKNVSDLQLNKVHFIYPFYHTNMVHLAFRDVILMKYSQKLSRLNKYIHNNNLNKKISGGAKFWSKYIISIYVAECKYLASE